MKISILNAGQQTDYLYGLVSGLSKIPALEIEVIDSVSSIGVVDRLPNVKLLNLRGDNISRCSIPVKSWRIFLYYIRLLVYAAGTESKIFHIQWENSILFFDRTILNLYYKLFGKKLVLTAHNVYREERDGNANIFHWFSLKIMYHIMDRIIVHTPKMKDEICSKFHIQPGKIIVIRHGINVRIARTGITKEQARRKIGVEQGARLILCFGQIDKYKGIETLIDATALLIKKYPGIRLLIAGKPKRGGSYAFKLKEYALNKLPEENVSFRFQFIPADEVEGYFEASDCLVLPYRKIFQSGMIFLAYRFGLPVIAANVGSFSEDVIEGETGFVSRPDDPADMASKLDLFFNNELYLQNEKTRKCIIEFAEKKYSWTDIGILTFNVYENMIK